MKRTKNRLPAVLRLGLATIIVISLLMFGTGVKAAYDEGTDYCNAQLHLAIAFEGLGIELNLDNMLVPIVIDLSGPAVIKRTNYRINPLTGCGEIDTEIVSMELTGSNPLIGQITLEAGTDTDLGKPPSVGQIIAMDPGDDYPAYSFFDVFFDVFFEFPPPTIPPMTPLLNHEPLRLEALGIMDFPPYGTPYIWQPLANHVVNSRECNNSIGFLPLFEPGNPVPVAYVLEAVLILQPLPPGSISGTKFNDANGNKARDPGEEGIPGWKILLKDGSGNPLAEATTDTNGDYMFTSLPAGAYQVHEVLLTGWTQTVPDTGYWEITLLGQNVQDVDFGNRYTGGEPVVPKVPGITDWGIMAAVVLLVILLPWAVKSRVIIR